MWILALIVVAAIGYFMFDKIIDQETKRNMSYLLIILLVVSILIIMWAIGSNNNF